MRTDYGWAVGLWSRPGVYARCAAPEYEWIWHKAAAFSQLFMPLHYKYNLGLRFPHCKESGLLP